MSFSTGVHTFPDETNMQLLPVNSWNLLKVLVLLCLNWACPLPLFNIFRKRELTRLNEDCALRERDFGKVKSGSEVWSKSSSDGKTGGIKICETGLSTNYARTGQKLQEVDTRSERCIQLKFSRWAISWQEVKHFAQLGLPRILHRTGIVGYNSAWETGHHRQHQRWPAWWKWIRKLLSGVVIYCLLDVLLSLVTSMTVCTPFMNTGFLAGG